MRVGHPVQGRRRHPLLRPARDQGRCSPTCRAVVNPADEVSRQADRSTCPSGASATPPSAGSTPGPRATGVTFSEALRRADGRRRRAAGPSRASRSFLDLIDELPSWCRDGPGRACSRRCSNGRGYVAELEAEHTIESEGRLENLAELVGARPRRRGRRPSSSSRSAWWPTPTSSTTTSRGHPHDAALGQGPRVPGRVPHRPGGRRLPPPPLARRARRARGGAPARPTSASPGPCERLYLTHAWAARCSARPSTTRRAGSSTRSPRHLRRGRRRTSRRSGARQRRPLGGGRGGCGDVIGDRVARRTATRSSSRHAAAGRPRPPSRAPRRSACRSATTSATASGARA